MTDNTEQADHGDETMALDPTVQETLDTAQARIVELEKELGDAKAKLAKARTGAKAKDAQGRKFDPKLVAVAGDDGDGNAVSAGMVLLDKIRAAETVELLALNARHREIAGFTQAISGGAGAFRVAGNGLRLDLPEPLLVTAPVGGRSAIHAWGLALDGKPAAFAARFEPLMLSAGQNTDLSNDVIF